MLVEGNQMNLNPVNPYNAAAEKAMAAQRPTGSRKKPVKSAHVAECASMSDETWQISDWMNAGRKRAGRR
jgi:hypothetical protein